MASKTLSWTSRSVMVPPTVSVATHTRVGGPPTSSAMQFGLRKTHSCFTNLHKPKHLVLAVLFSITPLSSANAYHGYTFFNPSFAQWNQASSNLSGHIDPNPPWNQLDNACFNISMTFLDDAREFCDDFDWSRSETAQTSYVQSFSSDEPVFAAPWQSTDFLVQQSVSLKIKDLRNAKHVLEIAIVAQIFACHLTGMRMGDVPSFNAKEDREQHQLIHHPHGHTGISPLFNDCGGKRNVGCNAYAVGQFVACMRWPYFCAFHDFSPLCFRRSFWVSSMLDPPRGPTADGTCPRGPTIDGTCGDLYPTDSDGDIKRARTAEENTFGTIFWNSLHFPHIVQQHMDHLDLPYGTIHVPHSGATDDRGLYSIRPMQLTWTAGGSAGHFGALDVEFHLALSDSALRGLSMRDLLIPGGSQNDRCALLGPGSAVDVCAEFAPMAPGLSQTHPHYSTPYDPHALYQYLLTFADYSDISTPTPYAVTGRCDTGSTPSASAVVCRGESKFKCKGFKPTPDAKRTLFEFAPYCVTDGHSIGYLLIAGYLLNVYRRQRWYIRRVTLKYKHHKCRLQKWLLIISLMLIITPAIAPPATRRGTGSTSTARYYPGTDFIPNMGDNYNFLPGMSRWDGIPYYDFEKHWWSALLIALGAIIQSGYTLLQTALEQDGGRDSNDDANDQRDHLNRNWRLYASILNYIRPTSRVYRIATRIFVNDGVSLFKWLKEYGKRDYDDSTLERLRRHWEEATMSNVGISFNDKALYEWMNWIDDFGDKLGKSLAQKRTKFYAGLPESFDHVIAQERLIPSPGSTAFVHPTNYPAGHPLAGSANPDSGKPNLDAIVRMYSKEWSRMLGAGLIKGPCNCSP